MSKISYLKTPFKPTTLSKRVLRARLSLRETQKEFAARFMVSHITVYSWEHGRTSKIQPIHERILANTLSNLAANGLLMASELFDTIYRTEIERKGTQVPVKEALKANVGA